MDTVVQRVKFNLYAKLPKKLDQGQNMWLTRWIFDDSLAQCRKENECILSGCDRTLLQIHSRDLYFFGAFQSDPVGFREDGKSG